MAIILFLLIQGYKHMSLLVSKKLKKVFIVLHEHQVSIFGGFKLLDWCATCCFIVTEMPSFRWINKDSMI